MKVKTSVEKLCRLFGMTRQAYYQHNKDVAKAALEAILVLEKVMEIRRSHPVIGTRKLLIMLQPFLQEHKIKMGRDTLFDLLAGNKLRVRIRKRKVKTTVSHHRFFKYPNLIEDFVPRRPNQLWVVDITYDKVGQTPVYISFVTDAYSHKIVGYHVSLDLEALSTAKALEMAIKEASGSLEGLIHHSDRGVKYCSALYVNILEKNKISIRMTQSGDPRENAVAERLNGIIKREYLKHYSRKSFAHMQELAQNAVTLYNRERPHSSCSNLTPDRVHESNLPIERLWKNYYKKQDLDQPTVL